MSVDPEQYPQGKINEDDEGVLNIAVFEDPHNPGVMVIHFGKKILWVGMDKPQLRAFGELLIQKSEE